MSGGPDGPTIRQRMAQVRAEDVAMREEEPDIASDPVAVFELERRGDRGLAVAAARIIVEMRDPSARRGDDHVEVIATAEAYLRADAEDAADAAGRQLEARRRAPLDGKARAMNAKIARAVELHETRCSPARIAQIMTAEGLIAGDQDPARSVRRWLAEAKRRTDREVSDSR